MEESAPRPQTTSGTCTTLFPGSPTQGLIKFVCSRLGDPKGQWLAEAGEFLWEFEPFCVYVSSLQEPEKPEVRKEKEAAEPQDLHILAQNSKELEKSKFEPSFCLI